MKRQGTWIVAALLVAAGCSDGKAETQVATIELVGAPIDAPPPEADAEAVPVDADAEVDAAPGDSDAEAEAAVPSNGDAPPVVVDTTGTDSDVEPATNGEPEVAPDEPEPVDPDAILTITFDDLSLEDIEMEDLLDALLYPDDYTEEEREFPADIKALDGRRISITGYMIPMEWDETRVPEFMLVQDLLACCFGGAPQPDDWISVEMVDEGAEYYPFIPVVVTGTFRITGIQDEAGYAAGAYVLAGEKVEKEL